MRMMVGFLALLLAAVGCFGGGEERDEMVVLRVLMADDWASRPPILDAIRQFEGDRPGVRVDIIGRPFGQIMDELEAAVALDRGHDVVQEHAFAAGARGLAEPLDDWWDGQDVKGWFPGAIEDVTWGATRYGVPLDINALFLVSNADLVSQPPTDFPELREVATAAAASGLRGLTVSSSNWVVYGWIRANGGEIVDVGPDGEPTFTLDRPENVQTLEFLAGLIDDGIAYGPTIRNVPSDEFGLFTNGQTGLLATGTWDTSALAEKHPQIRLVTSPLPGGVDGTTSGSVLGGSSLFVGRGTQHKDLALEFIATITSPEVAVAMAKLDGRLPPKPDMFAPAGLDDPVYDGVIAQLETAHPQRLIAFPEAQAAYITAVDDALTGRRPAAEALATAQLIAESSR